MENRFLLLKQMLCAFLTLFLFSQIGYSQSQFIYSYSGPDTLFVDSNCEGILDWGHPGTPTVTSNIQGCTLTSFEIFSITDNSGNTYPTTVVPPATTFTTGDVVTVTHQAMDDCGNNAFFGFQIRFVDNIAPTIDAATVPADVTVSCAIPTPAPVTGTDNCGGTGMAAVVLDTPSTVDPCTGGSIVRTFTITDPSGNEAVATQNITLSPNAGPVISAAFIASVADVTVNCNAIPAVPILTAADISDDCTAAGSVMIINNGTETIFPGSACPVLSNITRLWTIEDACGNQTSHIQSITVQDNTPPVIDPVAVTDITINCSGTPNTPDTLVMEWANNFTVNDNCGNAGLTWSHDFTGFNGSPCLTGGNTPGVTPVTYTVTDGCNSSSVTLNFTVHDLNPPAIISGAQDITVACDGMGNIAEFNAWLAVDAQAIASDACTPDASIVKTIQVPSDPSTDNPSIALSNAIAAGCSGGFVATVTVEFTYTDICGNFSTTDADFIIIDQSAPVITTGASDMTVQCDGNGNMADLNNWIANAGGAISTDACTGTNSPVTWRTDPATPVITYTCGNNGSVTVDFYASDACGNELPTFTTATFSITDTVAPIWTTNPTPLTIECDGTSDPGGQIATWLSSNGGGAIATDDCSPSLVTITNDYAGIVAGCGATGSVNVLFTANDGCGNTSSRNVTLTIEDTTPPVWNTSPNDVTIECDGGGNTTAISNWLTSVGNGGLASDGCSGSNVTYTNSYSGFSGMCGTAVKVYFTAIDDCGLTALDSASLTINDTTNPTITTPATTLNVGCGPNAAATINAWLSTNGGAAATDACGAVSWTNDYTGYSPVCPGPGVATVNFEAKDLCGNTIITSANINVTDNGNPEIYIDPTDVTIPCADFTAAGYTAWLNSHGGAFATDSCTVIDNSSGSTDWTYTENITFPCPGATSYSVTFTVTDECGRTDSRNATYLVQDIVSPSIDPTSTTTFEECGGGDDQMNLNNWIDNYGGAIANDFCSNATWVGFDFITNDQFPSQGSAVTFGDYGSYPVVTANKCDWQVQVQFRVTDECNNTSTTTSLFIINDTTDPVIAGVPADVTVTCSAPAPAVPTANDNCDASVAITMVADTVATCANTYVLTRTWTATDDCGNTAVDSQVITVEDNVAPMVTAPGDLTVECDNIPMVGTPTVNDACDSNPSVVFGETTAAGACANESVITRTWTVTDACGNAASASQTITVTDNTQPTINGTLPVDITVECNAIPAPPVAGTDIVGADNCGLASFDFNVVSTQGTDAANCDFYNYTITRSWVATDNCGNSVTHTQTITVEDNSVPTFTTPANITIDCEDVGNIAVTGNVNNALDVCGVAPTVTYNDVTISTGACAFEYTIERTWSVADPCNNTATGVQMITVNDISVPMWTSVPQDVELSCTTSADADMAYNSWLTNYGLGSAVDNCGSLTWYVLEPGSYDINDVATFTTPPVGLAGATCPSGTPGVFRSDLVSFVVVDQCGNALEHNASFVVSDNLPPVFTDCPASVTLNNDPGVCGVAFDLMPPFITDECNSTVTPINVTVTEPITSPIPGDDQTIVNPVVLNIGPLPTNPAVATDPVTLTIDINNFDGEEPTEFFAVYAEDNTFVGNTANSAMQCGNSTVNLVVTAAQLNAWIADDGFVTFNLLPNVTVDPIFAINDICPIGGGGSTVTSSLQYNSVTPSGLTYGYSIDGGAVVNVPLGTVVPTTLDVGSHSIQYFATDCAGNQSSCSYTVEIIDNEPPTMGCPSDVTVALAPGQACNAGVPVTLQPPTNIFDNCGFQTMYSQVQPGNAAQSLITYSYNPNYLDYVADDKAFTFFGTGANAVNGFVTFTVRVEGDVEDTDEYFEIYGEDGSLLGTTQTGQPNTTLVVGTCPTLSVSTTTVSVPVATFNAWAADGQVSITAEAFDDFTVAPPGTTGDGISPACVVFANNTPDGTSDGMSNISVILDYTAVTPTYYATGATTIGNSIFPVPITSVTHDFNVGVTTVVYQVEDINGLIANCTYTVTVEDNNAPSAVCQGATIFVNPDGTPYVLDPAEIDGGSFDDCSINSMTVSPSSFDCSMAGSVMNVTLTVTDDYGNSSTCIAPVNVQIAPLQPTASTGICGNTNLDLFANAPTGAYTYQWSGPNNYTAFTANPVIPNATPANSGTYSVVITSASGCSASGSVVVNITGTPTAPAITVSDPSICTNQSIVLNSQAYSGTVVSYTWYQTGNTTPVGTTTVPVFSIPTPASGSYSYYVVVEIDGCVSDPSGNIAVTVSDVPNVSAVNNNSLACASGNSNLTLMPVISPVDDGSYTYSWTGPNNFVSAAASPTLANVTSAQSGSYTLTVTNGAGCVSNAYTQLVSIEDAPDLPIIASQNSQLCEGSTLQLNSMNTYNGTSITYTWTLPDGSQTTTTTPTLNIPAATVANSGNYSVSVDVDGCTSMNSANFLVNVSAEPAAPIANSNSALCEGQTLQLTTDFVPGATYFWTGPNGFNSSLQNPTVDDVTTFDAGNYIVYIIVNGCVSPLSAPVTVTVNEAASAVVATNNGPLCADAAGSVIELSVTSASAIAGATYTWYNSANGSQIGAPTTSLTFAITDLTPYAAGNHSFYVIAQTNGCPTPASIPTTVTLDAIPTSNASAGLDQFVCDNSAVTLSASNPSVGTGAWTQTSGATVTIANPNSANTSISGMIPGQSYTFMWSLSNGACVNYSTDEVVINVDNAIAVADAGPDQVLCNPTNISLAGNLPGTGITGTWSQPSAQALLGVTIDDPTNPNTSVTGLMGGNIFQFIWTYSNVGCGDFSSDVVVITIGQDGGSANAGVDRDFCAVDEITLGANGAPQGSTGTWTTLTPGVTVLSPNQPNSFVADLQQGENVFVWSLNNAICGTYSQDTVVHFVEAAPVANDDTFIVGYNGSSTLDVLANDAIPSGYTLTYNDPATGTLTTTAAGDLVYEAALALVGTDQFVYEICSEFCPDECTTATVTLEIGNDAECQVPSIFTPNNDGVNDAFIVPCLSTTNYPNNEVTIFNQWGDEVYRKQAYGNDWLGTFNGEDLPTGTYFYVVDLGNGDAPMSGFLVLER